MVFHQELSLNLGALVLGSVLTFGFPTAIEIRTLKTRNAPRMHPVSSLQALPPPFLSLGLALLRPMDPG